MSESNKSSMSEPEMTAEGKYRCRADKQEYDTRDDYDAHCKEDHSENMESEMK